MLTESDVRAVLDDVIHPSFGLSLVALGMVHAMQVSPDTIGVDLIMNCPGCPAGEAVLALAAKRLKALDGVQTVKLSVLPKVWRAPWMNGDEADARA